MAVSNYSFESRVGMFHNAVTTISQEAEYSPSNLLISKINLDAFIDLVDVANNNVVTTQVQLTDAQLLRRQLCFKKKNENPRCMQILIQEISSYIKADIKENEGSLKILHDIISKMNPAYLRKKKVAATSGKEAQADKKATNKSYRPVCTKSFTAICEYSQQVNTLINGLGAAYQPSNPDIQTAQFQATVTILDNVNNNIALFGQNSANAITERRKLYNGENGMKERIVLIKNYLKSLQGSKNNRCYVNFVRALKGK
ncbi:MAG: hypothetical protein WCJ01_03710 [Ignavibacteria bacterium]